MNKLNVPQLRFKGFEGEWEEKKILDFAPLQRGFDLPVIEIKEGKYPVVFSNGILKTHNKFKAKAPGVVTGRSGTIGKITFVEEDYWPHNTSLWVTDFKNNEPKYVYFFFSNFKLERLGTGSGVPTLNRNDIHAKKAFFPTLPEQQKIASFLSAVDEKIQQLSRKKELLEQYKKGVMQQLFSGKLRFKDEKGNEYPDWEEKKLEQIGELKNGLNKDKKDFGFGSPFVNLMDVFGKSEIFSQEFGLVNSNEKEKETYNLLKGDVLFIRSSVKRSGVGETVIVQEDLLETVYSGFLIRFRDDRKSLAQEFKKYCFSSQSFRDKILSYATSSANTNINQESLNKINVILPCIGEQQKIANFLSSIDAKIENTKGELEKIQLFKKGLLQQLFV